MGFPAAPSFGTSTGMLLLRSALFNLLFYLNLLALMVLGLPLLSRGRSAVMVQSGRWGRSSLWLLKVICGMEVEFRGLHRIPPGALIVASKHQSFWEVFAFLAIFTDFTYVLKRELARIPLFGIYARVGEQIAIDRARGRAALAQVTEQARKVLADGRPLLIFPEGTRRPPGAPAAYKFGVAHIYAGTGATCLPVALNSGLFWPRRSFLRRPGLVVVEFLEPIEPGLDRASFARELESRIEAASARLLEESLARDPSLRAALAPA
jgi:1-acyl-sn-glycerol-3-phosphate acyltransferase